MDKILITVICMIFVIIGLLVRQWFINLVPKKTDEIEENQPLTVHEEKSQAYSDLTSTGVRIKLKLIQVFYLAYAILYMHFSIVSWGYITMEIYKVMTIIAAVYTVVIMAYNFKFETRLAAKSACYTGTLAMLFGLLLFHVQH